MNGHNSHTNFYMNMLPDNELNDIIIFHSYIISKWQISQCPNHLMVPLLRTIIIAIEHRKHMKILNMEKVKYIYLLKCVMNKKMC